MGFRTCLIFRLRLLFANLLLSSVWYMFAMLVSFYEHVNLSSKSLIVSQRELRFGGRECWLSMTSLKRIDRALRIEDNLKVTQDKTRM